MTAASDDTTPQRPRAMQNAAHQPMPAVPHEVVSAHARIKRNEQRIEKLQTELHGPAGEPGLKDKVAVIEKQGEHLLALLQRMERDFHRRLNDTIKAVEKTKDPRWAWQLILGMAVGVFFTLSLAAAARMRGLW